ncbi:hypothetical protein [Haladaptatus halobius]|uniref:hypothetical protein n=1 Tax=Haladaptatus halobius TaxID=2884875 RepID=UPI001D0B2FA0|nr:hypothetical protein [Haladaptatus halobius]
MSGTGFESRRDVSVTCHRTFRELRLPYFESISPVATLGRLLSQSVLGTALGLVELFSAPSTSPTPAGAGSPFAGVAIVLLFGAVTFALGGWLIEYFR